MNNTKLPVGTHAFTLLEIMVTVIIVGIIAAFAIPNYSRTVDQTHEQDAMMQLSAIRTANQLYYAKTLKYWPSASGDKLVDEINLNLSLNIIENGLTFKCFCTGSCNGAAFSCTAIPTSGAFTVTVTQAALASGTNPSCSGTCPY